MGMRMPDFFKLKFLNFMYFTFKLKKKPIKISHITKETEYAVCLFWDGIIIGYCTIDELFELLLPVITELGHSAFSIICKVRQQDKMTSGCEIPFLSGMPSITCV